ncbi:MAG: hypothetical protein LKG38_01845 [Atopobiaceae bacterium]|jgi:hypothetical protein|nr:hypothetical protein [Atopobiaceae bacterium]MCH4119260.1 hypothetical protein [Atopobiaceae bacterium]MCI1318067.1 hypothetical protein [Atopobiaceae bacterium]MCI1388480.1 hypothetical protein [Atopobiaceae bacterium]MCI1431979.1 hypothetical protein [Atopobiaceae bacterium]
MTPNPYLEDGVGPDSPTTTYPATPRSRAHASQAASCRYARSGYDEANGDGYGGGYDGSRDDGSHWRSRRGGGWRGVARVLCVAVAWVARALAILACVAVVASAFGFGAATRGVSVVYGIVLMATPSFLRGTLSFATILGGAFRGDFAVLALALFLLDWVFIRVSASLR